MHRKDDAAGKSRAKAAAIGLPGAQRSGGVNHDGHAELPGQHLIAGEVDVVAEGGIWQDDGDGVAIAAEHCLLGGLGRRPIGRVDVAEQRSEATPQGGLGGRGEGE